MKNTFFQMFIANLDMKFVHALGGINQLIGVLAEAFIRLNIQNHQIAVR